MIELLFGNITLYSLITIFFGVSFGIITAAIPGITISTSMALLLPFTYYMDSLSSFGLLLGVFTGGMSGGAISSILINIPGNPAAVITNLSGYPFTLRGKAHYALGLALIASVIGSFLSWIVLFLVSVELSKFTIKFGAVEQCALIFFGLCLVSLMNEGSPIKAYISMFFGLTLATIGLDPISAYPRFDYGQIYLQAGISYIPVMIGIFALPSIFEDFFLKKKEILFNVSKSIKTCLTGFSEALKQIFLRSKLNTVIASIIGVIIGAIPGTGSVIAATIAYNIEKKRQKSTNQDEIDSQLVIAPEAANSSLCGGALIPTLTLGIPGDGITAVLLGALMIHGLTPGPLLIVSNPEIYYGILGVFLIGIIFLAIQSFLLLPLFMQTIKIPNKYLMPLIFLFCIIGTFALRNSIIDIWVMLIFGILGFFMIRNNFPVVPMLLALILGEIFEQQLRMSLIISLGDPLIFFKKPISLTILTCLFLFFAYKLFLIIKPKLTKYV